VIADSIGILAGLWRWRCGAGRGAQEGCARVIGSAPFAPAGRVLEPRVGDQIGATVSGSGKFIDIGK